METPPETPPSRGDVRPAQEDLRVTLAARQDAAGPEAPKSPSQAANREPETTVAAALSLLRARPLVTALVVAVGCGLAIVLGAFAPHASHRRSRGATAPGSAAASPLLHIAFVHGRTFTRVPYGSSVHIHGVANNARGRAMTIQQTPVGSGTVSLGKVLANDQGNFEFTIPAGGRRSVVATLGSTSSNRLQIDQATRIIISARHNIRARRPFRIAGRVFKVGGPGVTVKLQVRRPGRLYQTALTLRTRSNGSFRGHVRLRLRDARYRLRALVPTQSGFQYARSTSNIVVIRTH